jgi:hypothetical protein
MISRVREYIRRVLEAHRQVREADERLHSYEGELYPEDLNDAVCEAIDRRFRVIWGGR